MHLESAENSDWAWVPARDSCAWRFAPSRFAPHSERENKETVLNSKFVSASCTFSRHCIPLFAYPKLRTVSPLRDIRARRNPKPHIVNPRRRHFSYTLASICLFLSGKTVCMLCLSMTCCIPLLAFSKSTKLK